MFLPKICEAAYFLIRWTLYFISFMMFASIMNKNDIWIWWIWLIALNFSLLLGHWCSSSLSTFYVQFLYFCGSGVFLMLSKVQISLLLFPCYLLLGFRIEEHYNSFQLFPHIVQCLAFSLWLLSVALSSADPMSSNV